MENEDLTHMKIEAKDRLITESNGNTLSPKQENFAQVYVETNNASEAYRQSYNVNAETKQETVWSSASQLLANPKVTQRVLELQESHRRRHNVNMDGLTADLNEAFQVAKEEKQAAAMTSATMAKAKLHGLIADKRQIAGKDDAPYVVKTLADFYADAPEGIA